MKSHELEKCPVCGEGQLMSSSEVEMVEYKGQFAELPMRFAVCDRCGIEHAGPDHLRLNKRSVVAFHKGVDGLLTGAEVRRIRESLQLTQGDAARIFGGGPVAFSKYENDEVSQSESMDRLLRVATTVPQAFAWLADYAGLSLSIVRLDARKAEKLKLAYCDWTSASSRNRHAMPHYFKEHYTSRTEHQLHANDDYSVLLVGECA